MKKILSIFLIFSLLFSLLSLLSSASGIEENDKNNINTEAEENFVGASNIEIAAKSAILMEASTGAVLYAKGAHDTLAPASVTKIMTLLLVAEAVQEEQIKLDDKVTVSANAASMGGSQIFIKEGEIFTVEELLKSTVIASANDAAVALAELIAGSESAFVAKMNDRAKALGMKNTEFENCTGLDDTVTKHLTSAYDIALMSRELIKHDIILQYSNVWQDSIRNGEFTLTNTNRLVRYYSGCTGLKTGSTDKAGYCVSATAKRDGMHLIAVVMGAETRDKRNDSARALLDFGFSNYALYKESSTELESVPVRRGGVERITVYSSDFTTLVNRADLRKIEKRYVIPEFISAPIIKGESVGKILYVLGDAEIGSAAICVHEDVNEINFFEILIRLLSAAFGGK